MELWSQHTQKQFEILREQSQELTSTGQKVATANAEPLSRSHRQEPEDVTVDLRHSRPCLLGARRSPKLGGKNQQQMHCPSTLMARTLKADV